jgi:hypothetical protein
MIFSISQFLSFIGSHFLQKHIESVQMDQEQESRARRILKRISNIQYLDLQSAIAATEQGGGAH